MPPAVIPCAHCDRETTMPNYEAIVYNHPHVSQLILMHPEGFDCRHCGGHNQVVVEMFQIKQVRAMKATAPPRLVTAGTIPFLSNKVH